MAYRPVSSILKDKLGLDMPFWSERLKHPCDDDYWAPSNWYKAAQKLGGTSVNALIQSGWFDDDANGTLQAIRLTDETGTGERRLLLGAWCHAGNSNHELGGLDVGDLVGRDLHVPEVVGLELDLVTRDHRVGSGKDRAGLEVYLVRECGCSGNCRNG